jgi:CubicO group peptidase (beta-lactamase class C family)
MGIISAMFLRPGIFRIFNIHTSKIHNQRFGRFSIFYIFGAVKKNEKTMKRGIAIKSVAILFILGTIFSCSKKPADPSVVRSSKYKESLLDIYPKLNLYYSTNFIPGMSVAVSIDNQVVLADGFGYSNYELKVHSSPTHKYRIGQVSELITALTAAKLYEEGKLQVDRPVSELVPQMSQKPHDYTIRQLGAHSAGIRKERAEAGKGNLFSLESIIPSFIDDDLAYEPGTAVDHTELGFDLLGYLIEKTQNKPFTKVVKQTLLDTLKLKGTIPDIPYRIADGKCTTYDFDYISQPVNSIHVDFRGKEASAGYLSSVLDLVKMGNLLLYPGFLKQETIDLLTTPYKLNGDKDGRYGFGVIIGKERGGRIFYGEHGGVTGGCAAILIYPEEKMVIAIAANINSSVLELPVFDVAQAFMKQLHPEMKNADAK